jgi:hypothetical protein
LAPHGFEAFVERECQRYQDGKTDAVGRRRTRDQADPIADIRGYLRSAQKMPHVVHSYLQEQHVRYAR